MSWRERMARASFRGFDFLTDSHEAKGGRRLVVHEFPGADTPLVEDLGGKAQSWRISAYFLGENYDLERNGFLAKLALPGADWLMHPWLGYLYVRPQNWSLQESNDKGGYGAVTIDFVPGGETVQPVPDKVDVAYTRIQELGTAAQDDFVSKQRPLSATAMNGFVAQVQGRLEVLRQVISLATLPLTWAGQIQGLVAGIKEDLAQLLALPQAYANAIRGLTDLLGSGADDAGLPDTARPRVVARLTGVATGSIGVGSIRSGSSVLAGSDVYDAALRYNVAQESALRSRLLIAAAAQVAMADYRAAIDRDAVLVSVVVALDSLLPGMPDPVFQAAVAARTALVEALQAQDLMPAASRDVVAPLPSVVLAHRLGVDEAVFLARNAVRHPLFVQGRVYG